MRLLANENVPRDAVVALQEQGHDVVWVRTAAPGSRDEEVLELAKAQGRVLMTFDKDFGELALRWQLPPCCGVVLLRLPAATPSRVARVVAAALASRDDWAGHFAVIEEQRIRMRPLANAKAGGHP